MPFISKLMQGAHLAALEAVLSVGEVDASVTATGSSSQANSYGIVKDNTYVTAGGAGTGVRLPLDISNGGFAQAGDNCIISNQSGNAVLIYPPVGGSINSLTQNASLSLSNTKTAQCICHVGGSTPVWSVLVSA